VKTGLGLEASALQAVGVARRAGRVEIGTRAVRQAGREGRLAAILVARDASDNARERFERVRLNTGAELVVCGDRSDLGRAVGRGPVAALGITEPGLAELVLEALQPGCEGSVLDPVSILEA
jgi:ribosomal protein L7Ae-like RNA K-turn-binding protein